MSIGRPTTLLEGLVFPEAPRWHDDRLWLSDVHGHQVMTVDLQGRAEVMAVVHKPSGIGFLPDGTPLVVSMHAQTLVRIVDGEPQLHADLSDYPGEFLNDMVVDGEGRAYVGMRSWRQAGQPPASKDSLILVHPDGSSELAADNVTAPNGVVITPDGGTLILAETHALRLTAFDRGPDGRLGGRRSFASLKSDVLSSGRKAYPDGICLDAEGAVWVGTAMSGEYTRVGEGGAVLDRFAPNAAWATACATGGEGRGLLLMVTCNGSLSALSALNDADSSDHGAYLKWAQTQMRGFVEVVALDVPGAGIP